MTTIPRLLPSRFSRLVRPGTLAVLGLSLLGAGGCERVKAALRADTGDPRWSSDSATLASKPDVLFQVIESPKGTRVVPMATIGERGLHAIGFGNRGWRAFDLEYLQKGHQLHALRGGRSTGTVSMTRGMWDPPTDPLDSIPCPVVVPAALADVPDGTRFLTNGARPALRPVTPINGSELQEVLATVPTLIAPTLGVSGSVLARFKRQVFEAATGVGTRPSIIIVYDDPEALHDSVPTFGQRPRQLIVIMDRGVYGYRRSYSYSTVNRQSGPRLRFVDYVDVDNDGRAELFFGVQNPDAPLATIVLRYANEAWTEILRREGNRCAF